MPNDGVLVDEGFVASLHHAVRIFEFAAIYEIIRVGESDPPDSGQAVQASRPDRDMALVAALFRRRSNNNASVSRE